MPQATSVAAAPPPAVTSAYPDIATELTVRRLGPVRRYFLRHPVVMDLLVMLVFLLGVISPAGTFGTSEQAVAHGALVAVGTVLLFWRRRRPVLVAVAMITLAAVAPPATGTIGNTTIGLGLVVYAVAASRPPRIAWLALAAALLVPAGPVVLWERATTDASRFEAAVSAGVEMTLVVLIGLSIGTAVRGRRLHVAELIAGSERLRRERDQQALIARAAERSRIAREMHDVVTHSLSVMVALADGAGAALDRSPEASRAALNELSATGRTALADMRRVLGVLDGDGAPLEPQPGRLDLDVLVERFRAAGVPVVTDGLGTDLPQDPGLQLTVYRVVQEALTNTLRYAPGTPRAELSIRRDEQGVEVEVVDLGAGRPVTDPAGTGRGLIGMAERAGVYGGSVTSGPWRGGWRVLAVLPWKAEAR
ncbi:sensor histidine kinase [Actinotalea sp.]|uniref:sensor histidine kinase n=1 Tax=Actinotalea sp. TaxID=1872145 RepID=UPI003569CAE4